MERTVTYTATAARTLKRHANRSKLIRGKIHQYASDPQSLANNVTELKGTNAKRLRVGDYRVIFMETDQAVTILDIGPRGEIYD